MNMENKSILALAVAGLIGLAAPVQAAEPDKFIADVITDNGGAPRPLVGLNGARITDAEARRDVCALTLAYAALLRSVDKMPSESMRKLNTGPKGCIERIKGRGWGQL